IGKEIIGTAVVDITGKNEPLRIPICIGIRRIHWERVRIADLKIIFLVSKVATFATPCGLNCETRILGTNTESIAGRVKELGLSAADETNNGDHADGGPASGSQEISHQ